MDDAECYRKLKIVARPHRIVGTERAVEHHLNRVEVFPRP
jgi:hypothetical protein